METKEFLQTVVTGGEGWFCLALGKGNGWLEQWHHWPEDIDAIVARAESAALETNVYFSSYLFRAPQSVKENVLPTRTIQADLDHADVRTLPKQPTILVETSPGRHQAYWILDETLPLEEHEFLSRKLTYAIPLCDRSGWALGRKVRIANTLNHKYMDGTKPVRVIGGSKLEYAPGEFELLPDVQSAVVDHFDDSFIESPTPSSEGEANKHGLELLDEIKSQIPVSVYTQYSVAQADRSAALYAIMCWGFKAGLTRQQVFILARDSANNKFADLRHRGEQELAKDVLRAEFDVNTNLQDDRRLIQDIRRRAISLIERKQQMFNVVFSSLKAQGEFLHTETDAAWYIRRDTGRPIFITANSDWLDMLLDQQFGLNPTEPESRYVIHGLKSAVAAMPVNSLEASLSYFDVRQGHFLLHLGKRDVLRITANSIESAIDGAYGVIFPWITASEAFTPILDSRNGVDWGEELFGNGTRGYGSSVDNVTNMTPDQARALLKVWFIFVLLRAISVSRPIIASFGAPGSGKTTLFRKVYAVLYGARKSLSAVTNVDDFDHSVAHDPLVILDNVDTWEKWLPDRMALSAGTTDITRRKLYTDADTVVIKRQAIVGVTAHNPKFGREDVADRFLLFAYSRLGNFISEEMIISDIVKKRNYIWGGIIRDIQKVLATPIPTKAPQFRVEDFARFGMWIATALGVEKDFVAAIEDVKSAQSAFTLEEEGILVSAISKYVDKTTEPGKPHSAAQLWTILSAYADDPKIFEHTYRNSVALGKKLAAMQSSLTSMFVMKQVPGPEGMRFWSIDRRNGHDSKS
jgi:hypothetical protein